MTEKHSPFSWIDASRELRIIPQYSGDRGITVPVDHKLQSLTISLSVVGDAILDYTHRLEKYDSENKGALSSCMAVVNQTIRRERMVNTFLDIKEWPQLKPYMITAQPDFVATVEMWIAIGKTINRDVTLITFDWYDRKRP